MRSSDAGTSDNTRVSALLGPTNTGKTHRAIARMLDYETGIIGLPLRLLAREVYDRVSVKVGEQAVALVTGEEKRVPHKPRYWVCTTEAMPLALGAEFVAVDEIQLVGHPERGHVFTDRLLHARGTAETWFLGSSTVEGLLRAQLPGLRVVKLPRLSQLAHRGQSSLRTLPRRSAVVAFSMPQVYELADALRRRRGGAAVVLGALSPRVRNAQVALYQAGEVDFLVATDAIGMGLNLDVDHVALAGTVKFDGFETRPLESAEMAQIVGRAGRHLRDGTFGTLSPEPELPRGLVQQLEQHRFASQRFAYWRNPELDFASLPALLASLARRPPRDGLRAAPEADDVQVLRCIAQRPELLGDAPPDLRVLWDVCRIPNYEKRIPEHQAAQLVPVYRQLADGGRLTAAFLDAQLGRLARFDGDIHALMERLASVRTWAYATHQSGWVEQPEAQRARARALEEQLSDALHERLLERFVEKSERRRARVEAAPAASGAGHRPFASLAALGLIDAAPDEAQRQRQWTEALIDAPFEAIALSADATLRFEGERVATLIAGQALTRPALRLQLPDWVEPGARARIERRLGAHLRDVLAQLLGPLSLDAADSAPLRGLGYQLGEGLGTRYVRDASEQLDALGPSERALLAARGIVVGRHTVYAPALLSGPALRTREALCRAFAGAGARRLPSTEHLHLRAPARGDPAELLALGFVTLPGWLVRCDVVERLLALSAADALAEARLMLGVGAEEAAAVVAALPRTKKRRRRRRRKAAAREADSE